MASPAQTDDQPHQPTASFTFPKRSFGKKQDIKRSFQRSWFERWNWLHYSEADDAAFCFYCAKADKAGKLRSSTKDQAFLRKGFSNWKDGPESFRRHEESKCHKEAYEMIVTIPKTVGNIGDMLSSIHRQTLQENSRVLLKILEIVRYLGRQGIAFRGHDDLESNFIQLFKLLGKDDPELNAWFQQKGDRYLSPTIQNEMLQLMSVTIQREISSDIHTASHFTIMADECTDSANNEQLVICFRWVDHRLEVHEDFVGLYSIPNISADTIFSVINDCLMRMNLQWNRCRGQCYDGAANMAGVRNGVATRVLNVEPKALYTHCYGHSLSLAMCDTLKHSKIARDALDTTFEISKLIKFSPKREGMFKQLKHDLTPDCPGIRVFCPTRWTVRAQSLRSVLQNYSVLQELWTTLLEQRLESEMRARITGVKAQMESFEYYFGVCVGELVLNHADNLSKSLQSKTISAAEGQKLAEMTLKVLSKIRNCEQFNLFWSSVTKKASQLDIAEPSLPRNRKRPRRFDSDSEQYCPITVEEHFRKQFFEILDYAINSIKSRFDQPGYARYKKVESLLIKAMSNEDFTEELEFVTSFYSEDINATTLNIQLDTLAAQITLEEPNLLELINYMKKLSSSQHQMFSEVVTLMKIVLVNPSTNSTSERSFSAMRRIKTYLRSSMSQSRLNAIMTLHVHKHKTDRICLEDVAKAFSNSDHRHSIFGTFA